MKALVILVLAVVAGLVVDRLMVAAEQRNWVYWRRKPTGGSSAAAALAPLHVLTQPSYEHVVAAAHKEQMMLVTHEDGAPPRRRDSEATAVAGVLPAQSSRAGGSSVAIGRGAAVIDPGSASVRNRGLALPREAN